MAQPLARLARLLLTCSLLVSAAAPASSLAANSKEAALPGDASASSAAVAWENIMTQGFESSFPAAGWTVSGDPTWGRVSWQTHGGDYSAWCAAEGAWTGESYANDMDARMTFGHFDLSQASAAELRFWYWIATESGFDFLRLRTSGNGSTWSTPWSKTGSSGWAEVTVDLSSHVGDSSVWIQFQFTSDYSNVFEGVYIDDIVLRQQRITDGTPPSISSVSKSSSYVNIVGCSEPTSVTVYAYVSDAGSGVNRVKLWYRSPDGSEFEETMNGSGNGTYSLTLRPFYRAGTVPYQVRAWDNAGNPATSSSGSPIEVRDCDLSGPAIANIRASDDPIQRSGCPGPNQTTIRADVTDATAVSWVRLYYQSSPGGTYTYKSMFQESGNTYSAQLGPFSQTGTVSYYVKARDTAANESDTSGSPGSLTVSDCDQSGPTISDIRESDDPINRQGCPGPNQTTIRADVSDPSGLDWVRLYYQSWPGGTYTYKTMSLESGSTYGATLGPFSGTGTVAYYVRARDTESNESSSGGSPGSLTVSDCDQSGPTISSIRESDDPIFRNGCPEPNETTIRAYVSDNSGLDWVRLYYQSSPGGGYTWKSMDLESGSTYAATIGPFFQTGTVAYYVKARDTASNEAQSSSLSIRVNDCDQSGPTISNIRESYDPINRQGCPSPNYTTIRADVADPSGVDWVRLHYQSSPGGDYTYLSMSRESGDTYVAALGPFAEAGSYSYYVEAQDDEENQAQSAERTLQVDDCDQTGPVIEDVDASPDPVNRQGCGDPETTTISARVYDEFPGSWVSSVSVSYRLPGYTVDYTKDMYQYGGEYQAELGPFSVAGTVSYRIVARDRRNNESRSDTRDFEVQDCSQCAEAPVLELLTDWTEEECDATYTIRWSKVEGAEEYHVCESEDPSFQTASCWDQDYRFNTIVDQSAGEYHYQVRANVSGCSAPWSNIVTVKVWPDLSWSYPDLYEIDNDDCDGNFTLEWEEVDDATRYWVCRYDEDPWGEVEPVECESASGPSLTVTGLRSGLWYYQVRAENCRGESQWSYARSVVVLGRPTLHPISNDDCNGSYDVSWSEVEGATGYLLQEARDDGFSSPRDIAINSGSETSWQAHDRAAGLYYYRVLSRHNGCQSSWSSLTRSVNVAMDLDGQPAPTLARIDNDDGDGEYLLSWTYVDGATEYELDSCDLFFCNASERYRGTWRSKIDGQYTAAVVSNHGPGQYQWRVRGCNCRGCGPWGNYQSVFVEEPERDFRADELEVTQAIQNLDNDVPLVAGKKTYVRLYASLLDGPPAGQVSARLEGRRNGVPLPGSPLSAVEQLIRIDGEYTWDRGNADDSWTFEIPNSWTTPGNTTFTGRVDTWVDSNDPYRENNTITVTAEFQSAWPLCVFLIPVRTSPETVSLDEPEPYQALYWAYNVFPASGLHIFTWPSDIAEEGFPFGWRKSAFELPEDSQKVLRALQDWSTRWDWYACDEQFTYGLVDDKHLADGGSSSMNRYVAWGSLNTTLLSQYEWYNHGGSIMARQMAGSSWLWPLSCASGSGLSTQEDWDPCNLGPIGQREYYGFDARTGSVIAPQAAGDLMGNPQRLSTPKPRWVSFQTYEYLFGSPFQVLATGASGSSTALVEAVASASEVLVVSGGVHPQQGTGTIDYIRRLDDGLMSARKRAELAAQVRVNAASDYSLVLLNGAGATLDEERFDLEDNPYDPAGERSYYLVLPYHAATRAVVLRQGSRELARRTVSASSPTVRVVRPNGGEYLEGEVTVEWQASDGDGDAMAFTVQYSPDGGQSWTVQADYLDSLQWTIDDLSMLPGSDNALVRVIAYDGFNTGSDASDAPFSVASQAPQVTILQPSGGQGYRAGAAIPLSGVAYDAEDGALSGDSLRWWVDGDQIGSGEAAWARGLAPGSHEAALTAWDSDGHEETATASLQVSALTVPSGDAPVFDGSCSDAAYARAATVSLAPYASQDASTVYLLRSGDDLYACFAGLDPGAGPTASVALHLDADGSADEYAQSDDYIFRLGQDHWRDVAVGDGGGDYVEGPEALLARMYEGATTWSAELCIDLSMLAPIGPQSRIAVAHYWVQEQFDDHPWPHTANWNGPQTWAECHLGSTDVYLPVVLKRFHRMPPAPVPTPTPTQPAGAKPVLFDEAHDSAKTLSWQRAQSLLPEHPDWVYCGQMAQDLSDEFTLVRNVDQPFTAGLLAAYNAVILPSLDGGLTEAERTALEDYMEAGGGVLWLGGSEWVADEFTQAWGVHLDGRVIFEVDGDGDYEVTDFAAHPAVSGVTRMVTNWDGSLDVSPPAVVLITSPATGVFRDLNDNQSYDDGEPTGSFDLAAAYESGRARMIVQSGSPYQDHGEEWRDNTPLMRAFLRWLTAARP